MGEARRKPKPVPLPPVRCELCGYEAALPVFLGEHYMIEHDPDDEE